MLEGQISKFWIFFADEFEFFFAQKIWNIIHNWSLSTPNTLFATFLISSWFKLIHSPMNVPWAWSILNFVVPLNSNSRQDDHTTIFHNTTNISLLEAVQQALPFTITTNPPTATTNQHVISLCIVLHPDIRSVQLLWAVEIIIFNRRRIITTQTHHFSTICRYVVHFRILWLNITHHLYIYLLL